MTKENELCWADVKAMRDQLPVFPSIWLTGSVRKDPKCVRASLNRHWLITELAGSERLPLNRYSGERDGTVYYYASRPAENLRWVRIMALPGEMLFVCWSHEIDSRSDPDSWFVLNDFYYDKRLSLWYARGADVLRVFPMLRPDWEL